MIFINVGLLLFIVTSSKLISCTELDSKNLKYKLASKFGLIDVSTKSEVIKNKDLLQACLDDFVTSHLKKQPKIITVILNKHVKMSNIYLEEIQKSYPTFVFTENYNGQNNMKKTRMNIFILLRNHNDLDDFQIKIHQIGSRGSTYTVFLVDHFKNKKLFIEKSNLLTKLLWIKKIANIVIIGFVENYYLAMNSNKFKPNILREPMDPVIVGQCQNGKWIINITLFEPIKMNNCSVNVGYLNNAPYMYAVKQKNNNKLEYKGIDLSILRVVANHLNFTIKLSEIAGTENDTKTQRIANSFDSNRSYDIVIGGITWQPTFDIDYTIPHDVAQLAWLVPVQPKKNISLLTAPVRKEQWILITAVILFLMIVKFILFHEISLFEIFAGFFGVACNRPVRFSYMIFFMTWLVLPFLLMQVCSVSLRDMVEEKSKIHTIEKLIESGITLGGLEDTKSLFIGNKTFENYKEFERIEYEKQLQDLMNGENGTMALLVVMNTLTVNTKFNPSYVYVLPKASIQLQLSFAVWHGLPYVNELDIILQRLIRSGIITHFRHIETKSYHNNIKTDSNPKNLINVFSSFSILGIGFAISLITLIFEIIIFRFKLIDRIYSVYLKFTRRV